MTQHFYDGARLSVQDCLRLDQAERSLLALEAQGGLQSAAKGSAW